ncbi:MAG: hypothetical protein AAGG69_00275 [Pseudomonadota bacterium]
MKRGLAIILGLIAVVGIAAAAVYFVEIEQTQQAELPEVNI